VKRHFWSNVAAVAYKEATVMRHDRALMVAIFIQPLMQLLLLGFALSNKPANVPWAILDQSRSSVSRRFTQEVQATGYFLRPRYVASYAEGRNLLEGQHALAFLVFPQSFARDVERGHPRVQLLLDGSDPLSVARIGGYVGLVAADFEPALTAPASHPPNQAVRQPGPIDVRQSFRFNPTLSDRKFYMAALAAMVLTNLTLSAMALGLVAERESGTYEQMLALPTTPIEIVLGKLVPYVGVAFLVMVLCVIAPGLIFGIWPRGSPIALFAVTLPFVLASLGIGVFVSALARTSAQAVFISVFFIMPSFVLSGAMLPYQLMPHPVREIGGLFPLRWYQIALRRILERGAGLSEVAVPIMVLTALFAAILVGVRWRMKPRLG
jgi:ABC-2 type transport system permease protein